MSSSYNFMISGGIKGKSLPSLEGIQRKGTVMIPAILELAPHSLPLTDKDPVNELIVVPILLSIGTDSGFS